MGKSDIVELPAQPQLEAEFLQACVTHHQMFPEVMTQFDGIDLSVPIHRDVYDVFGKLYSDGAPISNKRLFSDSALRSGLDLDQIPEVLYSVPQEASPLTYIDRLKDFASRRREILFADSIQVAAWDYGASMTDRMELFTTEMADTLRPQATATSTNSGNFKAKYKALQQARYHRSSQDSLHFAWRGLRELGPEMYPGMFCVVLAKPSVGKSIFLEQQAEYWQRLGFNGLFYHYELSPDVMMDRRVARNTSIPTKMLMEHRSDNLILSPDRLTKIDEYLDTEFPGELEYVYCPGWTMPQLVADIRYRAMMLPIQFVMVDYFDKVDIPVPRGSYEAKATEQALELFVVALNQLKMVGLMAGQLVKGESKKMTGDNARGSAALNEKGNWVSIIDREIDPDTNRWVPEAEIRVTKFTMGQQGMCSVRHSGPSISFWEAQTTAFDDDEVPDKIAIKEW